MRPVTQARALSNRELDAALNRSFTRARHRYPGRSEDRIQRDLDAIVARAAAIKANDETSAAGTPVLPGPCRAKPVSHRIRQIAVLVVTAVAAAAAALVIQSLTTAGKAVQHSAVHHAATHSVHHATAPFYATWGFWVWALVLALAALSRILAYARIASSARITSPGYRQLTVAIASGVWSVCINSRAAKARHDGRQRAAS
jgi:hypothetical protein